MVFNDLWDQILILWNDQTNISGKFQPYRSSILGAKPKKLKKIKCKSHKKSKFQNYGRTVIDSLKRPSQRVEKENIKLWKGIVSRKRSNLSFFVKSDRCWQKWSLLVIFDKKRQIWPLSRHNTFTKLYILFFYSLRRTF